MVVTGNVTATGNVAWRRGTMTFSPIISAAGADPDSAATGLVKPQVKASQPPGLPVRNTQLGVLPPTLTWKCIIRPGG